MRRKYLDTSLCFALPSRDRDLISEIAYKEKMSMGEVIRDLINEGIKARGLAD